MASSINASITSTGIVQTADATGNLNLQGNGTTAISIDNTGKVYLPNIALAGTASAGMLEYNGTAPFFTPLGTQRGIIPGMQYYVLNSGLAGANATGAQSIFGVGVTLSSSTRYYFEAVYALSKSAGTTSHTTVLQFGGTATVTDIGYFLQAGVSASTGFTDTTNNASYQYYVQTNGATPALNTSATAAAYRLYKLNGTVNVSATGTFIPQYALSAAPGGAYTTAVGSYFLIYPIGASGANINVGTWA